MLKFIDVVCTIQQLHILVDFNILIVCIVFKLEVSEHVTYCFISNHFINITINFFTISEKIHIYDYQKFKKKNKILGIQNSLFVPKHAFISILSSLTGPNYNCFSCFHITNLYS